MITPIPTTPERPYHHVHVNPSQFNGFRVLFCAFLRFPTFKTDFYEGCLLKSHHCHLAKVKLGHSWGIGFKSKIALVSLNYTESFGKIVLFSTKLSK